MADRYPRIDDALAREVLDAIGVSPDDDVESVTRRFRTWLPAGSTAKWAAVDRGELPAGADPTTALEARLDGSLASWSCWPLCTGLGGVLGALGHDVHLAVEHRRGGGQVPLVDHHSVLVVDGCLLDPYLGPSAPVPPGHDVTRPDGWGAWIPDERSARPDHLGASGGGRVFRYRQLADHLDDRDVVAFCAISVTHTGVGRRRTSHWMRDGSLWFLREGDDGTAELRVTEGTGPFEQRRRLVARGPFEELRTRHLG